MAALQVVEVAVAVLSPKYFIELSAEKVCENFNYHPRAKRREKPLEAIKTFTL